MVREGLSHELGSSASPTPGEMKSTGLAGWQTSVIPGCLAELPEGIVPVARGLKASRLVTGS